VSLVLTAAYFLHLLIMAAVIFGAYRLQGRYALPFLPPFFYAIVFYSVFFFINFFSGLFGGVFVSPPGSGTYWFPLLSCPALAASAYFMFIGVAQAFEKTLPARFGSIYWVVQAGLFAFALHDSFGRKAAAETVTAGLNLNRFLIAEGVLLYLFYIGVLIAALGMKRSPRRRMIAGLSLSYIGSESALIILSDVLKIPHHMNPGAAIFFTSFLIASINVPVLLFLRAFLKKNFAELLPRRDGNGALERWFLAHHITPRERDVIRLILQGRSNREIAKELFLSEKTIKNNISDLFSKTGVKSRTRLIALLQDRRPGSARLESDF
jgi:DNA-binding CsgD family transcriptional regulator